MGLADKAEGVEAVAADSRAVVVAAFLVAGEVAAAFQVVEEGFLAVVVQAVVVQAVAEEGFLAAALAAAASHYRKMWSWAWR